MIKVADFKELKRLCPRGLYGELVSTRHAYEAYRDNWEAVYPYSLDQKERDLLRELVELHSAEDEVPFRPGVISSNRFETLNADGSLTVKVTPAGRAAHQSPRGSLRVYEWSSGGWQAFLYLAAGSSVYGQQFVFVAHDLIGDEDSVKLAASSTSLELLEEAAKLTLSQVSFLAEVPSFSAGSNVLLEINRDNLQITLTNKSQNWTHVDHGWIDRADIRFKAHDRMIDFVALLAEVNTVGDLGPDEFKLLDVPEHWLPLALERVPDFGFRRDFAARIAAWFDERTHESDDNHEHYLLLSSIARARLEPVSLTCMSEGCGKKFDARPFETGWRVTCPCCYKKAKKQREVARTRRAEERLAARREQSELAKAVTQSVIKAAMGGIRSSR